MTQEIIQNGEKISLENDGQVAKKDSSAIRYAKHVLGISENKLQLAVGEPDPEWKDYGLYTVPMLISGEDDELVRSGRKFVLRPQMDGRGSVHAPKLIADVSDDYELYPNEKLKEDLDKWAGENGYELLKALQTRSGNGVVLSYVPSEGLYKHATSTHAAVNEQAWLFAEKQQIKLGFTVKNSIDGTMGFSLGGFTFRMACNNGAIISAKILERFGYRFRADQIGVVRARHVPSIRGIINNLQKYLDAMSEVHQEILRYYSQLQTIKVNQQLIDKLLESRIPQKYLTTPSLEKSETVCEIQKDKANPKATISFDGNKNLWDAYNVLTDNLWHDPKPDGRTKEFYYERMHQAFLVAAPVITS
jgi:hypothetical protein